MGQVMTLDAALFVRQEKKAALRHNIHAVGQSADALLVDLKRQGARHNLLGTQLTSLLKDLRHQRRLSIDLAAGLPANPQFDDYIAALSNLRSIVAHWFTLHIAKPAMIKAQANDFEMLCFGALGAGVMWLDGLHQDGILGQADTTRDEYLYSSVFGDSQAHGEDITDQVQQMWDDEAESHNAVA